MNKTIAKNAIRLLLSQIIMWAVFILVDYIGILLEESNEYLVMFVFLVPTIVLLICMSIHGVKEKYILRSCKLPLRILYALICTGIWCAGTWLILVLLCEAISVGAWSIVWSGELAGIEYVLLGIYGMIIPGIAAFMYILFVINISFPKHKTEIHIVVNTFLGVLLLRAITVLFADVSSGLSVSLPIVWAVIFYNICYYKKQDCIRVNSASGNDEISDCATGK